MYPIYVQINLSLCVGLLLLQDMLKHVESTFLLHIPPNVIDPINYIFITGALDT